MWYNDDFAVASFYMHKVAKLILEVSLDTRFSLIFLREIMANGVVLPLLERT